MNRADSPNSGALILFGFSMILGASSFLALKLPDATTWTYMGLVLVVMLFFRFARPLQLRNLDLLLLFLLAAPLLYLRDVQAQRERDYAHWASEKNHSSTPIVLHYLCITAPVQPAGALMTATILFDPIARQSVVTDRKGQTRRLVTFHPEGIWTAYLWLLVASALLMLRCLVDLGLERRTVFQSNLTTGGLIWFGGIMLLVLIVKSFVPDMEGVPRQQHPSFTLTYLKNLFNTLPVIPDILALAGHTVVVTLLLLTGVTIFRSLNAGAAAAILYLILPYTAMMILDVSQVVPSVFVLLAIVSFRRPVLSALSLGIGTCLGFFPAMLVPAWMGFYFRRGHGRFIWTYLLVVLTLVIALSLTVGLTQAWNNAWELTEWQAWKFAKQTDADEFRARSEGLWNSVSLHIAYRIPLFILFMSLVGVSAFWPHPKNLGQLISWNAAIILGIQFWYADAGGIYILWYLPLLILQTLRPTLLEVRPPVIIPEQDRLTQWVNRVRPWARRLIPWRQSAPGAENENAAERRPSAA